MTSGSLVGSDAFTGALTRAAGRERRRLRDPAGQLTAGANYTLTFTAPTSRSRRSALTITADAKTKVYGDADPALTYQITSGALVGERRVQRRAVSRPGENVGSYAILQGAVTAGSNYMITYAGREPRHHQRAITVTADAQTKIYGDPDPTLTYQLTSGTLAFSDAFSGALTRDPGNGVATYAITQGTLSAGTNYVLSFTGANLTVTPRRDHRDRGREDKDLRRQRSRAHVLR